MAPDGCVDTGGVERQAPQTCFRLLCTPPYGSWTSTTSGSPRASVGRTPRSMTQTNGGALRLRGPALDPESFQRGHDRVPHCIHPVGPCPNPALSSRPSSEFTVLPKPSHVYCLSTLDITLHLALPAKPASGCHVLTTPQSLFAGAASSLAFTPTRRTVRWAHGRASNTRRRV